MRYLFIFRNDLLCRIMLCIGWSIFATGAFADTPNDHVLTEAEAIEQALKLSINLDFLSADVEFAENELNSTRTLMDPELRIRNLSEKTFQNDYDEIEIGMRFNFSGLGERNVDKQRNQVQLTRKRFDAFKGRSQLIARVRRAYTRVAFQDEQVQLAKDRMVLEEERLGLVHQLVDLGRRSIIYLTKAKMWHSDSKNELNRVLKKQNDARRTLTKLTGCPEDVMLIKIPIQEQDLDIDELKRIAEENRPEMDLVYQEAELAKHRYDAQWKKRFPQPTFMELSHRIEAEDENCTELSIGFTVPLFNRRNKKALAIKRGISRVNREMSALREQLEFQVVDAISVYRDNLLDWQIFKEETTRLIQESQSVIQELDTHEVVSADEVLELKLIIVEMQRTLSEKHRNLMYSTIDLCSVLGISDLSELSINPVTIADLEESLVTLCQ